MRPERLSLPAFRPSSRIGAGGRESTRLTVPHLRTCLKISSICARLFYIFYLARTHLGFEHVSSAQELTLGRI